MKVESEVQTVNVNSSIRTVWGSLYYAITRHNEHDIDVGNSIDDVHVYKLLLFPLTLCL